MKSKKSDYLGKAVLLTLVLIVFDLIGAFANLRFESWFRWTSTLIMVIAIIYFCIQFGKSQVDDVTFGKTFGYGFKVALVVSILVSVYSLISLYLIFPEVIDQILVRTRTELEAKGGMSEDQIEQGVSMTKKFMQPIPLFIVTFLATLFFGTIAALLGAAFTKKKQGTDFTDNR